MINKQYKEKIDTDTIIDLATELISNKPPTTLFGRVLRWIKKVNKLKNDLGVKIKKRS
jgi:hypothetical protein